MGLIPGKLPLFVVAVVDRVRVKRDAIVWLIRAYLGCGRCISDSCYRRSTRETSKLPYPAFHTKGLVNTFLNERMIGDDCCARTGQKRAQLLDHLL